jgi:hypothetical protein
LIMLNYYVGDIIVRSPIDKILMSYCVYVIELDDPKIVYVGQSWHSPEVRLQKHLSNEKKIGSRYVRNAKNPRLRPDLYAYLPSYSSRESAEAAETRHAQRLERQGFTVKGGH